MMKQNRERKENGEKVYEVIIEEIDQINKEKMKGDIEEGLEVHVGIKRGEKAEKGEDLCKNKRRKVTS